VLLVFSYLVVPAAVAALLTSSITGRLGVGWALGFVVSVLGLYLSYAWDLPTGATVVTTFGALMAAVAVGVAVRALALRIRREGGRALRGVGIGVCAAVALAGLLLLLFPRADHHWLDWLEEAAPGIRLAFLTPFERQTHHDSRVAIDRGQAERRRLQAMQQDAQWGARPLSADTQERLRQFLASRGEITAGDRMVIATLKTRARDRQRYRLGLPLLVLATTAALLLIRTASRGQAFTS